MSDWNKKDEFQSEKAEEEKIFTRKDMDKIIESTVDYTEWRCKRQFRSWLAEILMIISGISLMIYLICGFIERMMVLPTEPYRDTNILEWIFMLTVVVSTVFAQIVMYRNE